MVIDSWIAADGLEIEVVNGGPTVWIYDNCGTSFVLRETDVTRLAEALEMWLASRINKRTNRGDDD